jgi:hypothetical protein
MAIILAHGQVASAPNAAPVIRPKMMAEREEVGARVDVRGARLARVP